jgi:selenocysteine lyase/cysteine desulfurase
MQKKTSAAALGRRRFLGKAAMLAMAAPVHACSPHPVPSPAAPRRASNASAQAAGKWENIRREFDLDYTCAHFAGFLIACHPRVVRDEIELHRAMLQKNPAACLDDREQREDEVRASAARYLGVDKEQIALTGSTTMGLALVYNGIPLRAGQEVLTTPHDHYATQEALKFRSDKDGTVVRTVPLFQDPRHVSVDEIIESFSKHLNDKTRLVALTWVHSGSGVKLPIARIGKIIEAENRTRSEHERIIFCVDGVHGFGVEEMTFDELGCDFFIAGTHKWMFGPRGTGIICSRTRRMEGLLPTVASFSSYDNFGTAMTHGGFHAFEHQWALKKAFEFHLSIGKAEIASRIHALNTYFKQRLAEVPRVELVTPRSTELSSGFTFFRVHGVDPYAVEDALWEERIVVSGADRDVGPVVRMAPGLLNDEAELDRVVAVLKNRYS